MTFSPDGKWLAFVNQDRALQLVDVASRKTLFQSPIPQSPRWFLAFSADAGKLVFGSLQQVQVLDRESKRLLPRQFTGQWRRGPTFAIAPDGRTLAILDGHRIHLYELLSGQVRQTLGKLPVERTHSYSDPERFHATSVAFAPTGRSLLVGTADGTALLFDLALS